MENPESNAEQVPSAFESVKQEFKGVDVEKKVHQFYFPKILPYNDPIKDSMIEEAEKRMAKLDLDYRRNRKISNDIRSDSYDLYFESSRKEGHCRLIGYSVHSCKRLIGDLQEALDKLSTTKAESRGTDFSAHSLRHLMLHGSKSLAEEKILIRQKMASQQQAEDVDLSREDIDFRQINISFRWLQEDTIPRLSKNKAIHGLFKEVKELKKSREKAIANDALTGNSASQFCLAASMENQIKLLKKAMQELEMEISKSSGSEQKKNRKDMEKKESRLVKERFDISQRWDEEHKYILRLKKKRDEENAAYNQHLSVMENARELAQKKDAQGLEELSRREVDRFMSEWNRSESFRDAYKERIFPSFHSRGLTREGGIKNPSMLQLC